MSSRSTLLITLLKWLWPILFISITAYQKISISAYQNIGMSAYQHVRINLESINWSAFSRLYFESSWSAVSGRRRGFHQSAEHFHFPREAASRDKTQRDPRNESIWLFKLFHFWSIAFPSYNYFGSNLVPRTHFHGFMDSFLKDVNIYDHWSWLNLWKYGNPRSEA